MEHSLRLNVEQTAPRSTLVLNLNRDHRSYQPLARSTSDTAKRRILHAPARVSKPRNRTVVGPACELLLHRLREHRSIDVRVGGRFRSELTIKVARVQCIELYE